MKSDFGTVHEILDGYHRKSFTSAEVFQHYFNRIQKLDRSESGLNAFITILDQDELLKNLDPGQRSIPIAHKDIFSTKGIETTAASNILKGYSPPYNATSVERLNAANFKTIGKLNCDAFAHGATGENSDFGPTKNPYHLDHVPGGSSSGSAAAVAAGLTPVATATDTGGSIRLPASFTNTVGLKPTYGRVSRYGVIAMTSSTDSIGHITRTVWDSAYILNQTAGYDQYDATSSHHEVPDHLANLGKNITGKRIGLPSEYLQNLDPEVEKLFQDAVGVLEELGVELIDVSLPHTQYGVNAYYIITPAEISSNLARFDGVRFGHPRSEFGEEAKRRILMGTYCLSAGYYDAYYLKAQKVRTLIIQDFKQAFDQVDLLVAPISPSLPPRLGEVVNDPIKAYMMDALTIPANLAGVPGLTVPAGFHDGLPFGVQFIGDHFTESELFQVGHAFEQETMFYQQLPESTDYE